MLIFALICNICIYLNFFFMELHWIKIITHFWKAKKKKYFGTCTFSVICGALTFRCSWRKLFASFAHIWFRVLFTCTVSSCCVVSFNKFNWDFLNCCITRSIKNPSSLAFKRVNVPYSFSPSTNHPYIFFALCVWIAGIGPTALEYLNSRWKRSKINILIWQPIFIGIDFLIPPLHSTILFINRSFSTLVTTIYYIHFNAHSY